MSMHYTVIFFLLIKAAVTVMHLFTEIMFFTLVMYNINYICMYMNPLNKLD